jgi:hypothetical protein
MNCEWVESVPGIAIDESKRSFPGINHLRLFSNLWFVELVVEHRRGITPTDRVPESIRVMPPPSPPTSRMTSDLFTADRACAQMCAVIRKITVAKFCSIFNRIFRLAPLAIAARK